MCAMALVHARAARVIIGRPEPGALPGAGAGLGDRAGKRRGPPPRLHGLAGLNHRYSVWVVAEEEGEEVEGEGREREKSQ